MTHVPERTDGSWNESFLIGETFEDDFAQVFEDWVDGCCCFNCFQHAVDGLVGRPVDEADDSFLWYKGVWAFSNFVFCCWPVDW